jgi:coenzyme F390 synthetase
MVAHRLNSEKERSHREWENSMPKESYFNPRIETMPRDELDELINERIRYTVQYAADHSPFYKKWFSQHGLDPGAIRDHEDLRKLPIVSGKMIRAHQPPETPDFEFLSAGWNEIFTIHETSGTSGTPKSFFLTWDDWMRYAEKYARIFVSQGFGPGDRVVICSTYGMNIGANTMTLAARDSGITIIPIGKCNFPSRILSNYRPTGIVGSIFKLLHLAHRMRNEGHDPRDSSIERLIVGGESFAEESRNYLSELWNRPVYNTYGSTEGTMCGECTELHGLHVPEDLVHLDVYDPGMENFVTDGECGRAVLTTLIPVGGRCGTLLLNYDTEDTTVVVTRGHCSCGRTHMKILNPQREAETYWILGTPVNRVDIEQGVFQRESMEYLTGEYEAFIYGRGDEDEVTLRLSLESRDPARTDMQLVKDRFLAAFFRSKPDLAQAYGENLEVLFNFTPPGGLELYHVRGRPRRFIDRRDYA